MKLWNLRPHYATGRIGRRSNGQFVTSEVVRRAFDRLQPRESQEAERWLGKMAASWCLETLYRDLQAVVDRLRRSQARTSFSSRLLRDREIRRQMDNVRQRFEAELEEVAELLLEGEDAAAYLADISAMVQSAAAA